MNMTTDLRLSALSLSASDAARIIGDAEPTGGIRILGVNTDGNVIAFLGWTGQIVTVTASATNLAVLGGDFLRQISPEINHKGEKTGDWNARKAFDYLQKRAQKLGLFTVEKGRGTGLWRVGDGVHYHNGDGCYALDGHTYIPAKPGIEPTPCGTHADGAYIYSLIEKGWGRQQSIRVTGWIVTALAAGAMSWRPHLWIEGPRGTGKSTLLNEIVKTVLGDNSILSQDATAAGVRQSIQQNAQGVLLDEQESDGQDPSKGKRVDALVGLARLASDGGGDGSSGALRGTANGKATSSSLHCSFVFASVMPAAGTAADASRIVPVVLQKTPGAKKPLIDSNELVKSGKRILGRIMSDWAGLQAEIEKAKAEMRLKGMENRECDTVGTLTGCARWVTGMPGLEVEGQELRERFDGRDDAIELFRRLLQIPVQGHGSTAFALCLDPSSSRDDKDIKAGVTAAAAMGLRLEDKDGTKYVFVAGTHDSIKRNLGMGGWATVLKRITGALDANLRLAGIKTRGVLVPVKQRAIVSRLGVETASNSFHS